MKALAEAICEAFPGEVPATYYVPRVPATKTGDKAVCPKGILYDKYIGFGRLLRDAGVRGSKQSATVTTNEEGLLESHDFKSVSIGRTLMCNRATSLNGKVLITKTK